MTSPRAPALQFGPFTLNVAEAQLTRDGQPIALRPKAFELLVALVRRPHELVTKDELLDAVWGRRFITEGVIKSVVGELRTALGDDPKQPLWIETVPRRGYRFTGHIDTAPTTPATALWPAAAAAAPTATPAVILAGNLPAVMSPLVGRDAELAGLAALLAAQRLLTLAGPSGIGKTSLAQALAATQRSAWPDGVWFVELAALATETTTAATLCATLAQTLQLDAGAGAAGEAGLVRALQPLSLLIVIDNAEHLLAPLAALVAGLLAQVPALKVVVTSQEPLRIAGEQIFRLLPLSLPSVADDADAERLMASSAVRLFVDRVAGRLPGFALAPQQQRAVAGICRALDGLPLALELAAARVPLLGVHGISDMLLGDDDDGDDNSDSARLRLLTQGARTAAPRQRTLRDALAWSHDLLDEPQRRVFRRLGVFRGGFTLEAAQEVCADEALDSWAVLDAAHALVDKSLLAMSAGADAHSPPRFTLLESLRVFALERLAEAGEAEFTRQRHAHAVLAGWKRADARALSDPVLPWLALHLPELDNLRAALRWALAAGQGGARADDALALVTFAGLLWHRAGLVAEGRTACDAVRAQAEATNDTTLRAGFDLLMATMTVYASAFPNAEALASARRAAAVFSDTGDAVRGYFANYLVYQLSLRTPTETHRDAALQRMAALVQSGWSELLLRYLRNARGYELRLAGQTEAYLDFCRDELARCRRLGAVTESWASAQGLMLAENDAGHVAAALDAGREALHEIRIAGRLRQHGPLLALWTTLLAERGEPVATRAALTEALPALRGAGTPWMLHVALVWLAATEGRVEVAARLLGWRDARQRARSEVESGATIQRALRRLSELLEQRLGQAALAALRHQGAALDDAAAERLALAA